METTDMAKIFHALHNGAYLAIVLTAVYGVYCLIVLWRQINRRTFKSEAHAMDFVDQIREQIQQGNYEEAEEICKEPAYWYKAVAWLTRDAMARRHLSLGKLRTHLVALFSREILIDMESLLASVNMVVKSEPMLGLLGTVLGMIGAFTTIATIEHPSPQKLMGDLSVALNCTALGLISSIPLLMIGNFLQVKIRRMEESTFGHMNEILEEIAAAPAPAEPVAKAR
jgi:biopolymer transport protein ExbB/TolQ